MRTIIIIFLIFPSQSNTKSLQAKPLSNVQNSISKLVDKLVNRLLKVQSPVQTHLDKTVFAKTHYDPSHGGLCTRPQFRIPHSLFPVAYFPLIVPQSLLPSSHSLVHSRARESAGASLPIFTNESFARMQQYKATGDGKVLGRRWLLAHAAGIGGSVLAGVTAPRATQASISTDDEWPLWPALPLAPFSKRKTIFRDAGPGVWMFDQLSPGLGYITTPMRMTVIAMEAGGLFVYAPVAPTRECLALLQPLIERSGPIKYIILPSAAIEHKVLAGPFARAFPSAEFWTTDQQYSLPADLPPEYLGFPRWTKQLPPSGQGLGLWSGEFEHEVLATLWKPS